MDKKVYVPVIKAIKELRHYSNQSEAYNQKLELLLLELEDIIETQIEIVELAAKHLNKPIKESK